MNVEREWIQNLVYAILFYFHHYCATKTIHNNFYYRLDFEIVNFVINYIWFEITLMRSMFRQMVVKINDWINEFRLKKT